MEQAVRLPDGGAVTGWASCRLHGGNFFDGLLADGHTRIPVPLSVGPLAQLTDSPECTVSREQLAPGEIVTRYGIPCTRPSRALFDCMRSAPDLREAVVAMDMAAAAELVSVLQMTAYACEHPGWRNVEQVRKALPLASEDSRSPNETRLRLIWQLDAGLPRPLVNKAVFTRAGRLLGYADLLDVEAGVVGEFDGADHRGAQRHSKDVDREDHFRRHGLEYFKVTGPDLPDRGKVCGRMHSARSRARWLSEPDRAWTIEPPPGWDVPLSLDERLDLRRIQIEMYLELEREASGM